MSDPRKREERKPFWERPAYRLGALVFAGAILWVGPDQVQQSVCDSRLMFGTPIGDSLCGPQLQQVPQSEAELTADMFIGRAGAAAPEQAWEMLTTNTQSVRSKADFVSEWGDVLWAERIGELKPQAGHNQWLLRFRTYGGSHNEATEGDVNDRQMRITLVRGATVDDNRVEAPATTQRTAAERRSYARVIVGVNTMPYNLPTTSARPAPPEAAEGGLLRVMCQTSVQGGDWWLRTPSGWIDAVDLRGGGREASSAPACGAHHAAATPECDAPVPHDPRCARYEPRG